MTCSGCGYVGTSVAALSAHIARAHHDDRLSVMLASYTDELGPDECWPWLGTRHGDGYAVVVVDGTQERVGRLLLGLDRDDDRQACHRCDNPPCVNRAHLFAASIVENQYDKRRKGRAPSGEDNPAAKLTATDVAAIRARLARGDTQTAIAEDYGVTRTAVYWIKKGRNW